MASVLVILRNKWSSCSRRSTGLFIFLTITINPSLLADRKSHFGCELKELQRTILTFCCIFLILVLVAGIFYPGFLLAEFVRGSEVDYYNSEAIEAFNRGYLR